MFSALKRHFWISLIIVLLISLISGFISGWWVNVKMNQMKAEMEKYGHPYPIKDVCYAAYMPGKDKPVLLVSTIHWRGETWEPIDVVFFDTDGSKWMFSASCQKPSDTWRVEMKPERGKVGQRVPLKEIPIDSFTW